MNFTREQLIDLCERGVVPVEHWRDRDSSYAQMQLGQARALLAAGCEFTVRTVDSMPPGSGKFVTDDTTIWVDVTYPDFHAFEEGAEPHTETFYLPTEKRLAKATEIVRKDWY